MTLREDVWNTVLERLAREKQFRVRDVIRYVNEGREDDEQFTESQRQTVRRSLRRLEDEGWLTRTSKQSPIWRIGWKAELLLDTQDTPAGEEGDTVQV